MNLLASAGTILAELTQEEWSAAVRRGFQEECSDTHLLAVLIAVAALAGLWLIWRFTHRPDNTAAPPIDALAEAALRLKLSRYELQDLHTVAQRAGLTQPGAMLLSPTNLAHAVRAAQAVKDDPLLAQRVDQISQRLFNMHLPDRLGAHQPTPPTAV